MGSMPKGEHLAPDEWMARIGALPLQYEPGTHWLYNMSSDMLGVLIARVTGMSLENVLRQRVFEPLGMEDTSFWVPPEKRNRFSVLYATNLPHGHSFVVDHPSTSIWAEPPLFPSGAAGLVSTAGDYLRFGRMLLNQGELNGKRILSRKTVEVLTTDHLTPDQHRALFLGVPMWENQGFGFGVAVVTKTVTVGPSIGAFQWGGMFGTAWQVDPREEMVSVMMIQRLGGPSSIGEDFTTLVYQAIDD